MGVNKIMNLHCHYISLPHNYTVVHAMEINQKHIFLLGATSQNKSKVLQVNEITTKIQKQKEIYFNLNNADLEPNQKQNISEFLANYRENFALDLTELGRTALHKIHIETKHGLRPVRSPFYSISPHESREIDR